MEIFIDTANIDEIEEAATWGIIDGVTTNPSLISKTGKSLKEVIGKIIKMIDGPISVEVISKDKAGMIKEAERLSAIHPNIVVKIPATWEGLKAVKILSKRARNLGFDAERKEIKTNVTLIFSATQALLFMKAGATYISPFVGRMMDYNYSPHVADEIIQIVKVNQFPTKILIASIRNPLQVTYFASMGVDAITIPFKVLKSLMHHELTDKGLNQFLEDWGKVPKSRGTTSSSSTKTKPFNDASQAHKCKKEDLSPSV